MRVAKKNPKKFIEKQVLPNKADFYFLRARKIGKDVGKNLVINLKYECISMKPTYYIILHYIII